MNKVDNYYIYIGTSNTNILTYTFTSQLSFNGDNYWCPFGSTKTRYQFKKIFLIQLTKDDETQIYTLTITKQKHKYDHVNSSMLGYNGWSVPLIIWHYQRDETPLHNIETYFPQNYGNVTTDLNENSTFLKNTLEVGIVIPIYNRASYVNQFLSSLKKTDFWLCLQMIFEWTLN